MPASALLRPAIGLLAFLVLLLQGQLWVSDDGFREVFRLSAQIRAQEAENARLAERNQRLEAEVRQLREARPDTEGGSAVEERARADLGLIGPRESFYLFTGPTDAGAAARPTG